ncbi:MAG TPA: M23 family metallopeptidase [Stellaceae bacterium]|nr:M23 family metallopeptidase [Stellaceae bacterium]
MKTQDLQLTFPLTGEWSVVTTPAYRVPSHGTNYLAQRYAFDFTVLDADNAPIPRSEARKYLISSVYVTNFYAWGREVLSPAAGSIVYTNDSVADNYYPSFIRDMIRMKVLAPLNRNTDKRIIFGNYVVVKVGSYFVLLAHLKAGSILVDPGDKVASGVKIAEVGNSGNASIPHLHLQAMDQADPRAARAIQCSFSGVEISNDLQWTAMPSVVPKKGYRVRNKK